MEPDRTDRAVVLARRGPLAASRRRARPRARSRRSRSSTRIPRAPTTGRASLSRSRCATTRRPAAAQDHSLVLFPAVMLRAGGRYAVVVTQRLFAAGDPARPMRRSASSSARSPCRSRLDAGEAQDPRPRRAPPRLPGDRACGPDLSERPRARPQRFHAVGALRDPSDMVAIKENALAAPLPSSRSASITSSAQRRLIVRGTLALPSYLGDPDASELTRDALGRPRSAITEAVPFTMTLPNQALLGPVPIAIFQHGSPGSQEDVLSVNNEFLDDAGYAIVGDPGHVQPPLRRRLRPADHQRPVPSDRVRAHPAPRAPDPRRPPGARARAHRDRGARLAPERRPRRRPRARHLTDRVPRGELRLAPFTRLPAVRAGGAGGGEHRGRRALLREHDPPDRPLRHPGSGPRLPPGPASDPAPRGPGGAAERRGPAGSALPGAPSVSGIGSRSQASPPAAPAAEPALARGHRRHRRLEQRDARGGPRARHPAGGAREARVARPRAGARAARGNVSATRTAGHFQYEPAQTPSCVAVGLLEGHHCPQRATESRAQILQFFTGALAGGAPRIIDPLP